VGYKFERHLKNLIINKNFQIKFTFRFFLFTFAILTTGGFVQYFISNYTLMSELNKIRKETTERQLDIVTFIERNEHATNPGRTGYTGSIKTLMRSTFEKHNRFLQREIRFINSRIQRTKIILKKNSKNLLNSFLGSLILVGILINILFALVYGILLSHKFAGNYYRLKKFALQLVKRDFETPLHIRKKDFFQETAVELDAARNIIKSDLIALKNDPQLANNDILKNYKV